MKPVLIALLLICITPINAGENGIFQGPFYVMTVPDAYHMRAGDLDKDGIADLVFCCGDVSQGHGFRIFLGSINGGFSESCQASFFRDFDYLVHSIPEFTGDGLPDVLFTVESLYMLYSGDGNGSISYLYSPNPGVGGEYMHDTEDCNGDSLSDFLFSIKKPGQYLHIGLNQGTGIDTVSWFDAYYSHVTDIATLCDVDQDGIADIIAAFTMVDSMAVYLGNGDGTFDEPRMASSPAFAGDYGIMCDADLNKDGLPDAVVMVRSSSGTAQMQTYCSSPSGYMVPMDEYLQEASVGVDIESRPIAGDFDMDGNTDLAIQGSMGWILPGLPGGSFDDLTTQALFYDNSGLIEMDTSDVDLDGDLDLLVLVDDSLMIWLNQTYNTGIGQFGIVKTGLSAFPNPASSVVHIHIDSPADASVDIYDASGRMIRSIATGIQSQLLIDISDLSYGVYYFRLSSENPQAALKLLVMGE